MQNTNFEFEILVHDDASTDNTPLIIKDFETKYPSLFRCVYQSENQFNKQNSLTNILFPLAQGKYIAICEGDDYWTDPYKLRKQVDFLEGNPNYVLSCHDAIIIDTNGIVISQSKLPDEFKRNLSGEELIKGAFVLTLSICCRNVFQEMPPEFKMVPNGDSFITSMLGTIGNACYQSEIQSAIYRSHQAGYWTSMPEEKKRINQNITYYYIFRYHRRLGTDNNIVDSLYERYYLSRIKIINNLADQGNLLNVFFGLISLFFICIRFGYIRMAFKAVKKICEQTFIKAKFKRNNLIRME